MSKYYTPTIEEFHVGFEFLSPEKQTEDTLKLVHITSDKLYPWTITKDNYSEVFECLQYGNLNPKVKYLDQEDIESLGFEHSSTSIDRYNNFDWGFIIFDSNDLSLEAWSDDEAEIVFKGTIKNKSELKRLLMQIGLNNK